MSTLSYVNVFARDIEALSGFYRELFGFRNIPRSPRRSFAGWIPARAASASTRRKPTSCCSWTHSPTPAAASSC